MTEFLSTLRSIHLLLIAGSVAVAAFALSPRDSALFHAAQAEAELLSTVDFDEVVDEIAEPARDRALANYKETLVRFLQAHRPELHASTESLTVDAPLLMPYPDNNDRLVTIRRFVDYLDRSLVGIDEYLDAFDYAFGDSRAGKPAHCYVPQDVSGKDPTGEIKECAPVPPGSRLTHVSIVKFSLASAEKKPITTIRETFDRQDVVVKDFSPGNFTAVFTIQFPDESSKNYAAHPSAMGLEIIFPYGRNTPCLWLSRKLDEQARQQKISQSSKQDVSEPKPAMSVWEEAAQLQPGTPCHRAPNQPYFSRIFPNLTRLWSQVANSTAPEAASQLSIKSMESRQSVNLAGLEVNEAVLSIVGPLAVFSISVYFLANLVMLRTVLSKRTSGPLKPPDFPWLCLYEDRLAHSLTLLTILILPLGSVVALLRHHYGHWDWSATLGLTTSCLLALSSWASLEVLADIRRFIAERAS